MSQPADLVHDVLLRVAEFLRKLPAEQLAELASGEAKLEVVPKAGRRSPARAAGAAAAGGTLPRPAQEIAATMAEIGDRASARQYLEDLRLTVPKLHQLAAELGITVRGTKPKLLDGIVEWTVGRLLDSEAISRAGGGR